MTQAFRNCSFCGSVNDTGNTICRKCGHHFQGAAFTLPNDPNVTHACEEELRAQRTHGVIPCPRCATPDMCKTPGCAGEALEHESNAGVKAPDRSQPAVEAPSAETEAAIHTAELWAAGKMIGGDQDEVREALLAEVKRLRAALGVQTDGGKSHG
jgi:hypothetical protein